MTITVWHPGWVPRSSNKSATHLWFYLVKEKNIKSNIIIYLHIRCYQEFLPSMLSNLRIWIYTNGTWKLPYIEQKGFMKIKSTSPLLVVSFPGELWVSVLATWHCEFIGLDDSASPMDVLEPRLYFGTCEANYPL